jgi:putative FmdB family regulatory protein
MRASPQVPRRFRKSEPSGPVASLLAVPIYEYKCPKGHVFELFQKMSDPPPEVCIVCDEGPLQKVLYPVAAHFKGSGFYSTDYGRKGRKPSPDGDKPSKSDSGGKSDSGDKKDVKKVAET